MFLYTTITRIKNDFQSINGERGFLRVNRPYCRGVFFFVIVVVIGGVVSVVVVSGDDDDRQPIYSVGQLAHLLNNYILLCWNTCET